jgi:hypothetical protein
MTEKHLLFLDYLLPILSKRPDGGFIDDIAHDYKKVCGISFDTDEIDHFESLYEYKYFTFPYSYLNRTAKITPETKENIDNYGSLSKYLNIVDESKAIEQAKLDDKEKLEIKIAKLTEINLTLQNKQLKSKIWFSIIGFILGVIATNWKEILILLKLISPPETK